MNEPLVLGAWNLAEPSKVTWFPLTVPRAWREQVAELSKLCSRGGYSAPPIRDLDASAILCLPPGTIRFTSAWLKDGRIWFGSPIKADLTALILTVRDWIQLEFGERLPSDLLDGAMSALRDEEWQWGDPIDTWLGRPAAPGEEYYQFELLPQWAAAKFLEHPRLTLGGLPGLPPHHLTFYRQVTLDGAEVVSWPPVSIPVEERGQVAPAPALASVVVRFSAQTVPGRSAPLLYHHVSLRRYWPHPLVDDEGRATNAGWTRPTVLMGMSQGGLPSQASAFTLVPMRWRLEDRVPVWPKALGNLLTVIQPIPPASELAATPMWRLADPATTPHAVQAAVVFNTQMGTHPIANGGVSVGDLAQIDDRLAHHPALRLERMGGLSKQAQFAMKDAVVLHAPPAPKPPKRQEGQAQGTRRVKKPKEPFTGKKTVPMHQPAVVRRSLAQGAAGQLRQIRILFRSPETYRFLEEEIVRVLQLEAMDNPGWFTGPIGKVEIVGLRIDDDLWNNLAVERGPAKQRRQQRTAEIKQRVEDICRRIPRAPSEGVSAALVEIPRPPSGQTPREADPKLAWRIGLGRLGYVNQHIHTIVRPDRDAGRGVSAVTELWRHLGVIPAPVFTEECEATIPTWLLTTFVLRRTRKTSAGGRAMKAIFALRVNTVTGLVEVSTPTLLEQGQWISYRQGLLALLTERWERPESEDSSGGGWARIREEQDMLLTMAARAVQGTLAPRKGEEVLPRVLWMTEAHNSRFSFPFLGNAGLERGELEERFLSRLTSSERERLGIVRVRTDEGGEVPGIAVDSLTGGRRTGLYRWHVPNQERPFPVFLSLVGLSSAFQNMLRNGLSRLDDGTRENRSQRPLEIAVLHAGKQMQADDLALITHYLRSVYPYFETDRTGTKLPFPMPLARLAGEEYAVDAAEANEGSLSESGEG